MTSPRGSVLPLLGLWAVNDNAKDYTGAKPDFRKLEASVPNVARNTLFWKISESYKKFPVMSLFFNFTALLALGSFFTSIFTNMAFVNPYLSLLVAIGSTTISLVILTAIGEFAGEKK